MRFAVIYSGYMGNIRRSFNSLRENILYEPDDIVDVFVITEDLSINMVKLIEKKNFKNVSFISGKRYSIDEIKELVPFNVVSVTEWKKDTELHDEYCREVKMYIDRIANYDCTVSYVPNYNTSSRALEPKTIGQTFGQYFMLMIGTRLIKEYEHRNNFTYDYIIKYRDRYIIMDKVKRNAITKRKLMLLGTVFDYTFMNEGFLIAERETFLQIFSFFYKKIGGYRPAVITHGPRNDVDPTFLSGSQFASHVLSMIKPIDIYISGYNVKFNYGKGEDTFGELLNDTDRNGEFEWYVYDTNIEPKNVNNPVNKIAIIYSGYIGNIKRSLNSLRYNLFDMLKDDIEVFIVTRNLEKNVMKYVPKDDFRHSTYIDAKPYTMDELRFCSPFRIVSVIEWEKDQNCRRVFNDELVKFIDRTRNYEHVIEAIIDYDTVGKHICDASIGHSFEQSFMISIGVEKIIEHEKNEGHKYGYIVRFRDRMALMHKVPREIFFQNKIVLVGNYSDIYISDCFVVGNNELFKQLFLNWYKCIGGYRSEKYKDVHFHTVDLTFADECQFALHLFAKIKSEFIVFSEIHLKHLCVWYEKIDDYGAPRLYIDGKVECEWHLNETNKFKLYIHK